MAQSAVTGRRGLYGQSKRSSARQTGTTSTVATRSRFRSTPTDLADCRFDPPDIRAIVDLFGFDQDVWPGWAMQWYRDWESDTSDNPFGPWCKTYHQSASYQEWRAPRLWATGFDLAMPGGNR